MHTALLCSAGLSLLLASGSLAQAEPKVEECWRRADAVESMAQRLAADDPVRLEAEHLLREGRGEGGSGEIEECLDYVEAALEALKPPASEKLVHP
jgi:hypothetical protein